MPPPSHSGLVGALPLPAFGCYLLLGIARFWVLPDFGAYPLDETGQEKPVLSLG